MRLPIIQIANSIASVIAGILLAAAFGQTSLAMTAAFAAGGVLLFFGSSTWAWIKTQSGFDSLVGQTKDHHRDHFDKTGIYEFDSFGRKISDLRREAATRQRQVENELADVAESARQEIKREFEAAPSVDAQFRAIQGYLAGMDGHSAVGSDGTPLTCLEQLKRVFRRFQSDVATDMQQVLGCGREIYQSTEDLVAGSEMQSDTTEKTNSLAELLSDRVKTICNHAATANEACNKARSAAESGLTQVATLADEFSQLKNQSALRERKLQALGQHTREVEAIVQTIGSLSSRTDLLALNASIESVRAGEHGRGFALVAEEVRALSEQSAQAVADITTRLELIQLETAQSLSMASGEQTVLGGVSERVSQSLNVLEYICQASAESTSGLEKITLDSGEQMKLTLGIVETLQRATETAQVNRSRAQGANWKAKSFDDLSGKIASTLQRFCGQTENAAGAQ